MIYLLFAHRYRLRPFRERSQLENKIRTEGGGGGPHPSTQTGESGNPGDPPPVIGRPGGWSEPLPSDERGGRQVDEPSDVPAHQGDDEERVPLSADSDRDLEPKTLTPLGELIRRRILNVDSSPNPNPKPPPYEVDGEPAG